MSPFSRMFCLYNCPRTCKHSLYTAVFNFKCSKCLVPQAAELQTQYTRLRYYTFKISLCQYKASNQLSRQGILKLFFFPAEEGYNQRI